MKQNSLSSLFVPRSPSLHSQSATDSVKVRFDLGKHWRNEMRRTRLVEKCGSFIYNSKF